MEFFCAHVKEFACFGSPSFEGFHKLTSHSACLFSLCAFNDLLGKFSCYLMLDYSGVKSLTNKQFRAQILHDAWPRALVYCANISNEEQ